MTDSKSDLKYYVRYEEGAALYSISLRQFQRFAKEAGAVRKIYGTVLVNIRILNEFIELHAVREY